MSESAVVTKKRDGSIQRANWQRMYEFHSRLAKEFKEKLERKPGTVSTSAAAKTTKKWLDGMNTIQLRLQAERVGIEEPEQYEELDELVLEILVRMGLVEREDTPTAGV